jgi:putative PIN family toxin of toxin-antitoxin system
MSFVRKKVVIDSNILVSAAIYPNSASANALRLAVMSCELYRSDETTVEIEHVLLRTKFDRYFATGGPSREDFLTIYKDAAAIEPITEIATDCSDLKDNKFLSLALSVKADLLITGDRKHLISMHPYRGIPIISEADFVRLMLKDLALNDAAKS